VLRKIGRMHRLRDYRGRSIRLTDERLAHIHERAEMRRMGDTVALTLAAPEWVVRSTSDPQVELYYRFCEATLVGDKYLCVAVKLPANDAFVLTAYLTDSIKRGVLVWPGDR
jgi:hypothetical protein